MSELGEAGNDSLGVGVVKLVMESEQNAVEVAQSLIEKTRELADEAIQRDLLDLIETIIVYKLPQKSQEEIAAMFSLGDLKKTKVYQEALEEGEQRGKQIGEQETKLNLIPALREEGFSLEKIAHLLSLPLEVVQKVVDSNNYQ